MLTVAVAQSSSGGVVICCVLPVLWMASYLHVSQGCSTSPPSSSAAHTKPWVWLCVVILVTGQQMHGTTFRALKVGNFPCGNTGCGVCGLWLPCFVCTNNRMWCIDEILWFEHTRNTLVWPVTTYGCESWTLRKNEETRLDTFELKELRKILRVSLTAKKTNEWFLIKLE